MLLRDMEMVAVELCPKPSEQGVCMKNPSMHIIAGGSYWCCYLKEKRKTTVSVDTGEDPACRDTGEGL